MKKHYLIPLETVNEQIGPEKFRLVQRPKYLDDLKISWAGVHLEEQKSFLIVVETDQKNIDKLEKNADVVVLDNTRTKKDSVKSVLKMKNSIKDNEDIIDSIGRLHTSEFKKENFRVA